MRKHLLTAAVPAVALLMLTGCIDDNYDLDNIDKTIGVSVNDLVVPVNLGTVTLNSIFDLENSESITKEDFNGKEIYVFNRKGDFKSDDIHISTFYVNPPSDLSPTHATATAMSGLNSQAKAPAVSAEIRYSVGSMTKNFTYHLNNVDSKVKSVNSVESREITLTVDLVVPSNLMADTKEIRFSDMVFQFPKGFRSYNDASGNSLKSAVCNIGTYDAATGKLRITDYRTTDARTALTLTANVVETDGTPVLGNEFDFTRSIRLEQGNITISTDNAAAFPPTFDFYAYYDLPGFEIDYFSGKIDYDIEGLAFDPVELNDMPEILTGDGTRVRIANPQLYLSLENTCAPYDLGGNIGLKLTANRPTGSIDYDLPEDIVVTPARSVSKFAISPEGDNLKPIAGYTAADGTDFIRFDELSDVLYGSEAKGYGIPSTVDVDFINPVITGTARRFPLRPLGNSTEGTINAVNGNYIFKAPLALADGSVIVYNAQEDDWDSSDLRALEVTLLEVTADASSDLPLDVMLTAHLLDRKGNRIGRCETPNPLKANADGEKISIIITPTDSEGVMTDIDGIYYEATASQNNAYDAPSDVPALSPEMKIQLKNLKLKVNGRYVKDLDDDDDDDSDNGYYDENYYN